MKESWKGKILSVLLAVAVVASSFSSALPMSHVNATSASGYTELTFDDWGLTDSFVENSNYKAGTTPSVVTSWNKIAVSGYVTFYEGQASVLFNTNGSDTSGARVGYDTTQGKVMLGGKWVDMYDNANLSGTKTGAFYSSASVELEEEVFIRVELELASASVLKVSLYVDEASPVIGYYALSNPNQKVVMCGRNAGDRISWRSVTDETPIQYTELSFDDWGLTDGSVENTTNAVSKLVPTTTPITTWNRVAISGYATFTAGGSILINTMNSSEGGARIGYNATEGKVYLGGKGTTLFGDAACSTRPGVLYSAAAVTAGTEVTLRVELNLVSENVLKVNLIVNEAAAVVGYYQLSSPTLKVVMIGWNTGDRVAWRSVLEAAPEEPIPYTEYTFSDWGITDGYAENTGKVFGNTIPITSWNKVAVSGYVTFTAGGSLLFGTLGSTDGGIRIIQNASGVCLAGKGTTLYSNAACSNAPGTLASSASVTTGEEILIRAEFDLVSTSVVKISLYVKEAAAVIGYYQLNSPNLQVVMHGFAVGDKIVWRSIPDDTPDDPVVPNPPINPDTPEDPTVSDTPQKALSEYEMLTFSDLGIGDATFTNETKNCNGKLEDWDGKVFTGLVTFPTNGADERDGIITIGGTTSNRWTGLRIGVTAEGELYIRDASGPGRWEISPITMNVGNDVRGQEIELSVTMTRTSANSVYVGVYVNDIFCGERLFADLMADLGATLMTYSSGATMKVASVTIGLSDKPQKDISEYKMLTFSDFGINNEEIVGCTKNCRATITNLDGKLFQGKVTFPTDGADAMDGILTIGGTASNRWQGLRVGVSGDGKLYILEGNNPAQRWNIAPETMGVGSDARGKELEIGLTFTCADARNVYVGLYVNGKFCGEKLFKNLVTDFGGTLMVYSKTAKIRVASSETPWTKFLKSDVNFAYFGFTDKWDSELTSIYKGGN